MIAKIIGGILLSILLGWTGLMFFKAMKSKDISLARVGVESGLLKPCDPAPNCVCSVGDTGDEKHYFPPVVLSSAETAQSTWLKISKVADKLGWVVVKSEDKYIHFTSTSKLMGFVDDIEFLLKPEVHTIHLKSSSRVGYSDLGANRKRMNEFLKLLLGDSV